MPTASGDDLFTRSRSVVSRVVAGETLIVPVRGKVGDLASIYSFNGTGTLIWQLLERPARLADLINAVEREYEVGREQAQEDVKRFLDEMLALGLLEALPGGTSAVESHAKVSDGFHQSFPIQTETSREA